MCRPFGVGRRVILRSRLPGDASFLAASVPRLARQLTSVGCLFRFPSGGVAGVWGEMPDDGTWSWATIHEKSHGCVKRVSVIKRRSLRWSQIASNGCLRFQKSYAWQAARGKRDSSHAESASFWGDGAITGAVLASRGFAERSERPIECHLRPLNPICFLN